MKIQPDGDFALLIPEPHDEGVNPLKLCPKCNAYKPPSHFKEHLTKLQARKQGFAGTHAVAIERSMCIECRNPRKEFNPLSLKEIANAVYYGVISEYEADVLREKRDKARSMTSADNMNKYHHNKRKEAWRGVRSVLRADSQWASNLLRLLSRTDRGSTKLYAFVTRYRGVLHKHMSEKVWSIMRTGPNFDIPPPPRRLIELLSDLPEPVGDLRDEWYMKIPYEQTNRIKPPALVREALGNLVLPQPE